MPKLPWTPWHNVVALRPDLRSGELTLQMFAANLYEVAVRPNASSIYSNPADFFALTYPTFNMRELAKDIALRLAGKSGKAVRKLALTYGGGKTHTLITLYHLFNDPAALPSLPAVEEFRSHIGLPALPRARVAALTFDYLDVEKGAAVVGPDGQMKTLKMPWSALAYQLGGEEALRLIGESSGAERDTPPATNVLQEVLRLPQRDGRAALVLMDEVLIWARQKAGQDRVWQDRIESFFHYFTQAAVAVPTCAAVISLLSSRPGDNDETGQRVASAIDAELQREREEDIQPVVKEDVAEVLRRRLFTPDSTRDRDAFRPHVLAALKGVGEMDEQVRKEGKAVEERFLKSYPFHPDLTEVFYTKWVNVENFQRTRGALRVFAMALREAEKWDESPLVSTNVFLSRPGQRDLSESARELANIATLTSDGQQQTWAPILETELAKAREAQEQFGGVKQREVEQAVMATFLHSQPIGLNTKASTRELLLLISQARPDKIELEKALVQWAYGSWFFDDSLLSAERSLPTAWRLGLQPNLKQMHDAACDQMSAEMVEEKLTAEIGSHKLLTQGAAAAGAKPHLLPGRPADVEEDGEFHFVVLGPKAACDTGRPSAEARRYMFETTGPDKPRVNKNAVVIAAPSVSGLDAARSRVREYLGWMEVKGKLQEMQRDPVRTELMMMSLGKARERIPDAIKQAYCIVITLDEGGQPAAFKITVGNDTPLFQEVKADVRARIQETAISADALLPGGPYQLWHAGDTARRVKDLVGAFAADARLPKMLNRKAVLDTLVNGCEAGAYVLRLMRPDKSWRTFWRQRPDDVSLKEPSLELVLPEHAALTEIAPDLLLPNALPQLWRKEEITFGDLCAYFKGGTVVKMPRQGYVEPVAIPHADEDVLRTAVLAAVRDGKLWLLNSPASFLGEDVPPGILVDSASLLPPPPAIDVTDLLPEKLPDAWKDGVATARDMADALSKKAGKPLPWPVVRSAIDGAMQAHLLEKTIDSRWPTGASEAAAVKLQVPAMQPPSAYRTGEQIAQKPGSWRTHSQLEAHEIQSLAEEIDAIKKAAAGLNITFEIGIELSGDAEKTRAAAAKINEALRQIARGFELKQ
jgi:hypothetical protein